MPQNYANHTHHPWLTYIASIGVLAALAFVIAGWSGTRQDVALVALLVAVQALVSMSRAYTTRLQDRIIRLEMQVRGEKVLTPAQHALLMRLRPKQIAALRFAGDEELGALVERTSAENLSPKAIKQAVTNWQPDHLRT
jgi:predicted phage-related endonuclease